MKKRLFFVMLSAILSVSLMYPVSSVCAEEIDDNVMDAIVAETERELLEDELLVIPAAKTSESEETPAQVNVVFDIPDGFHLSAMVQIMSLDDGTVYEINASEENGYLDACFIPLGRYRVISYGIQQDVANQYPMTLLTDDEFTIAADDKYYDIRIQLTDYKQVAEEIAEKKNEVYVQDPIYQVPEQEATNSNISTVKTYPSYFEDIAYGSDDMPYFTVTSLKEIDVDCFGYAKNAYDLHIEVIDGGVFEEAKVKILLNGSLAGYDYLTKIFPFPNLGITFRFYVPDDYVFMEGDYFDVKTMKFERLNVSSAKNNTGNMLMTLDPETVSGDFKLKISIISTGGRGEAKFSVIKDDDSQNRSILTIGEDGIASYEGMTFYFSDATFSNKTSWSLDYKCAETKLNYTLLYILIGIVATCGIAIFLWLLSKREKETDYRINPWKDRQDRSMYE